MCQCHVNECFKVVTGRLGEPPAGQKKISHFSWELSSKVSQTKYSPTEFPMECLSLFGFYPHMNMVRDNLSTIGKH